MSWIDEFYERQNSAMYDLIARDDDRWERFGEWCPKHGRFAGDCMACIIEEENAALPEDVDGIVAALDAADSAQPVTFDVEDDIEF